MDMTPDKGIQSVSEAPNAEQAKNRRPATRIPSIVVGIIAAVVVALSLFYLLRPEPLLVQGEADATRLDIAARVDGRVKKYPPNVARTFLRTLCSQGSTTRKLSPSSNK
jgi:HlyD family secretion protein